ncbi:MAG: alanine racemase [Pseudomonadota bacterium]
MSERVIATISRKALAHNLEVARTLAPQSKIVAVIKADAYGHGLLPCADALRTADVFGVTNIDEAEKLRAGGVFKDILIMQGLIERSDIKRVAAGGFQLVIHRVEQLHWLEEELAKVRIPQPLTFWLKMDTGMGRLGVPLAAVKDLHLALQRKPWTADVILMTHLANASLPGSDLNNSQLLNFARSCQQLADFTPQTSIAASSALFALDTAGDFARPGIMLYGSSPFAWSDAQRRRDALGLQNVMTLQARLINTQLHETGDNIGYNSQYICTKPMRVGIVSMGYADGYPSFTPNFCPVMVGTKRSMTLGRVSMDMLAVDLTDCPDASVGDMVTLWGEQVSVDEVAAHIGVISYQLTCGLSQRVTRVYR